MKDRHYPIVYQCTSNIKAKAVSILISKVLSCKEIKLDPKGRYILIKGLIGQQRVTFVNVCFPSQAKTAFLEHILIIIDELVEGALVLGGDFNFINDQSDTSLGLSYLSNAVLKCIKKSLHSF